MVNSVRKITVDLRKTNIHKKGIDLKKQVEDIAKSRQSTLNTIGFIHEEKDLKGVIAVKGNINEQLVLKLFNSTMNSIGTLIEAIGREVGKSYVSENNFPAFIVNLDEYDYNLMLEKVSTVTGRNEKFFFCTFGDKKFHFLCSYLNTFLGNKGTSPLEIFILEENHSGMGDEWQVKTLNDKHVADINGKEFDNGGQWDINIFDDELAKYNAFVNTLILFAASRRYHGQIQDRIKNLIHDLKKDIPYNVQRAELSFYGR